MLEPEIRNNLNRSLVKEKIKKKTRYEYLGVGTAGFHHEETHSVVLIDHYHGRDIASNQAK